MELFDTHAHLDDAAFDGDREDVLAALAGAGVALVMNPGCSLASSRAACALAEAYPFLYAAVGSHPDAADEVDGRVLDAYRRLAAEHPKVRAIGEIGLDYHYEDVPRQRQIRAFRDQMALARELRLPVIVHEREAHQDALRVLGEFPEVTGVFHCFSGSAEMARELVGRGWYVGFTGVLTFRNARRAREAAAAAPLERIVLETDSPYMSPEPFRGRRTDPTHLYRMAQALAEVKGVSPEQAARAALENGRRLYGI